MDLIEKLKASGPSREIDELIHETVPEPKVIVAPRYSESIDAALTLVPDNVWLEIKTAGVTSGPNERLYPVVEYGANDADHTVQAKTIPLALCIAALEARRQST